MNSRLVGIWSWGITGVMGLALGLCWEAGLRINTSASVPLGLWRETPVDRAVRRGDYVSVCPANTPQFQLAKARGYFHGGWCPGNNEILFKPIAAIAGDVVQVELTGIWVNGAPIAHSTALAADAAGRPLPAVAPGRYVVGADEVWLVSATNDHSFDSRYFGPLKLNTVRGFLTPLLLESTSQDGKYTGRGKENSVVLDTALIEHCAPSVAATTLLQIIKTESGGDVYAVNVNGYGRLRSKDLASARKTAQIAIDAGYSVDMGLMQINSQHLKRFHLTVQQAFDPCTNLAVGATLLTASYIEATKLFGPGQGALQHALSAYNTGNFQRGLDNGYVAQYYVTRRTIVGQPKSLSAGIESPTIASNRSSPPRVE